MQLFFLKIEVQKNKQLNLNCLESRRTFNEEKRKTQRRTQHRNCASVSWIFFRCIGGGFGGRGRPPVLLLAKLQSLTNFQKLYHFIFSSKNICCKLYGKYTLKVKRRKMFDFDCAMVQEQYIRCTVHFRKLLYIENYEKYVAVDGNTLERLSYSI